MSDRFGRSKPTKKWPDGGPRKTIVKGSNTKNLAAKRMATLRSRLQEELKLPEDKRIVAPLKRKINSPKAEKKLKQESKKLETITEEVACCSSNIEESTEMDWEISSKDIEIISPIYIVTDTNVFMHHLETLKTLLKAPLINNQKLIIYVPWMVIQELDYIKDESSGNERAQALAAHKLINARLSDGAVMGQSIENLNAQKDIGKSPDDKILACCLQAKENYDSVILLSADINLRNKSLINRIKAISPQDILNKLKGSNLQKIRSYLQPIVNKVVNHCCNESFGKVFEKMDKSMDNSFESCLKRMQKYWATAFREHLLKQCTKVIEELLEICNHPKEDKLLVERFKMKSKDLLYYLQDIQSYKEELKETLKGIDNLEHSYDVQNLLK